MHADLIAKGTRRPQKKIQQQQQVFARFRSLHLHLYTSPFSFHFPQLPRSRAHGMAQQAYDYLAQSARPQMPRRRRSSASAAADSVQLQQLSSLSLLASPQSHSGSSEASVPPSLVFSSSSASPASSLTSSPSLGPKQFSPSAAGPEPLSLGIPLQPSGVDLAKYASDIIRNEAYALLALAARLAPAAHPLLDDDGAHVVRTDSSSSVATDSSDDGSDESDDLYAKSPVDLAIDAEESRTNQAFRNVVALVQSMPRHGKILISGIGKSGIVARKMVATFCSLGEQASIFERRDREWRQAKD